MPNRITPFLTFESQAEEAVAFYTSVFEDSRLLSVRRYGPAGPGPNGSVMSATFELLGQELVALNAGSPFAFGPGLSLFVSCETQEEVDAYWEQLSAGGEQLQCGWLVDRFGVSWQIVPRVLGELLADEDRERANRVMEAMLRMTKIEIAELQAAYDGAAERQPA
ncbi:MAG TPA: VOC family protein [Gaiellaceae bacterium]|nr:VOC family protein [Gaiellaceae bacterium]